MSLESAAINPTLESEVLILSPAAERISVVMEPVGAAPATISPVNSVVLAGTVAEPGESRQIAGGAEVVKWSLRVNRGPERTGSDLIDCIALDAVLQQRALAWEVGTVLSVEGAIRRRFFRTAGRTTTRVEVEVDQVTLLAAA